MGTIRHEEYMRQRRELEEQSRQPDMVNRIPHYNRHGVEAIDATAATGDGTSTTSKEPS